MLTNRILILDNYDSFTYNLVQIVEEWGKTSFDIIKNDEVVLDAVSVYTKILLSPGPGLPSDAGMLLPLIRKYSTHKDIFGVCLGHQAIAQSFGGQLKQCQKIFHGEAVNIKTQNVRNTPFENLPEIMQVGRYHSWEVENESLPEQLLITAMTEEGDIMAIQHIKYKVFGVQFHPESIMTPLGRQLLINWLQS